MDVGDPGWSPRIFHPRLTETRFYRVIKTGSATLPSPTVTFSLYQHNLLVPSGQTTIKDFFEVRYNVSLGVPADILAEVLVLVNGQIVHRGYSVTGSAWVNTSEWPNGPHTIQVVARTVDAADSTPSTSDQANDGDVEFGVGTSSTRSITFNPYISEYFVATPFFEPAVHGFQEIVAAFQEDSYWRLFVLAGDNSVVDGYEGEGTTLYVAWDGTDFEFNPLPNGIYDYYIEARPKTLGPFEDTFTATSSSSTLEASVIDETANGLGEPFTKFPGVNAAQSEQAVADSTAVRSAAGVSTTTIFNRTSDVITSPDDKYEGSLLPVVSTNAPTSGEPPMPPASMAAMASEKKLKPFRKLPKSKTKDGERGLAESVAVRTVMSMPLAGTFTRTSDVTTPVEDKYEGSLLPVVSRKTTPIPTEPPIPGGMSAMAVGDESTSTPLRMPGSMFKGFAGVFGVGYQAHHISWQDVGFFSMPSGASGFTSTWAPYGRLRNAAGIANQFSTRMTTAGWRRAFSLSDDSFRWYDLTGCYTGDCDQEYNPPLLFGGSFGRGCEVGLLVGHMIAADTSPLSAAVSYFPFWNPKDASPLGGTLRSYSWVALPEMDFGQSVSVIGGSAPLKWMGLYGCNSLRLTDVNDMWTKFLLPFPPNLRVLLGSDNSVYIVPEMGSRFADNMNGSSPASQGTPMTVIDSWYNAGTVAHQIAASTRNPFKRPGEVRLTAVFRASGDGLSGTHGDTIWNYPPSINLDYTSIQWEQNVVHTP